MSSSAIRGKLHLVSTGVGGTVADDRRGGLCSRFLALVERGFCVACIACIACVASNCDRNICCLEGPWNFPPSLLRAGRFSRLNVHARPFRAQCEQDGSFVRLQSWVWVHYSYQFFLFNNHGGIPSVCPHNICHMRDRHKIPSLGILMFGWSCCLLR